MKQFLFALFLIPSFALASKIQVIFFGGYAAGKDQMAQWQKALTEFIDKSDLDPSAYDLRQYPYPSGVGWDKQSALRGGAAIISSISQEMNKSENSDTKYILVGHSSGSALSNAIGLRAKYPNNLTHVVLDGFRPDKLKGNGKTLCYSAHSKRQPELVAPNRRSMLACEDNNLESNNKFIDVPIDHCTDERCLHFSVLNANPKIGKIKPGESSSRYYDDLVLKADWLPKIKKPAPIVLPVEGNAAQ